MIIQKLEVQGKEYNFSQKSTLIYSGKNSKGKTSLVRLMLYSLGYPIPSTKGINFSKLETHIEISTDGKTHTLIRKNTIIEVRTNKKDSMVFKLPEEQDEVIALVTNVGNPQIANNILGISYFDQDKGWTLLNRGVVIGKYRFSIESLINGLSKLNLENIQDDLVKENTNRKSYLQIKQLIDLQDERQRNITDIDWSSIDDLQDQLRTITIKFNRKKEQLKNFEIVAQDNKKFDELLEKMKIVIQVDGHEEILTSKNIVDYDFNRGVVLAQLTKQKNDLQKITTQKNQIEKELNNQLKLINVDDQIERFNQQISEINISRDAIESKLEENRKEILRLRNIVKKRLNSTDQVQKIYDTVVRFAELLGIQDILDENKDFIFTSNLKVYSGAKLHLLVFGFRLALLKVVQDQLAENYPIIIDSPMSGELDTENVKKMFDLLDHEFPKNQIIVASIYKFERSWSKRITFHNGVFGGNYLLDNK